MSESNQTKAYKHFLTFYTAAPNAVHTGDLGKLMREKMESGELISTGMVVSGENDFTIIREGDSYSEVSLDSYPATAEGFALFRSESRQTAVNFVKEFLSVAGDGESKVFELHVVAAPNTGGAS